MAVQDYMTEMDQQTGGARQAAEQAGQNLANVSGQAGSLPYKLRDALQKKLDYNQDIIGQQAQVEADYIKAPAEARVKYQDIWDPVKREALVAGARAQAWQPYSTLTGVLDQRMGQVSDIVGQGVAGWQDVVNQANLAYQAARQNYADLMNQYQFAVGQDQFDQQMAETRARGSGGGTSAQEKADAATLAAWEQVRANAEAAANESGNPLEYEIWRQINMNQGGFDLAGADVNRLWALHQQFKNTGEGGAWGNTADQSGSFPMDLNKIGQQGLVPVIQQDYIPYFQQNPQIGQNIGTLAAMSYYPAVGAMDYTGRALYGEDYNQAKQQFMPYVKNQLSRAGNAVRDRYNQYVR